MMLRGLPPEVQQLLRPAFRRIVQEEVPGFFAHERDRTARIVKRGRLRNEDEWYIVRHRVDEIERDNSRRQELAALLELLEQYEGSG